MVCKMPVAKTVLLAEWNSIFRELSSIYEMLAAVIFNATYLGLSGSLSRDSMGRVAVFFRVLLFGLGSPAQSSSKQGTIHSTHGRNQRASAA